MEGTGMAGRLTWGRSGRIALVAVVALAMQASAASFSQNDASTGGDAPGTLDEAAMIKGTGTFSGNFTSDDVRDWYKVKLAQSRHDPVCVSSRFTSEALVDGHVVAVAGDEAREVVGRAVPLRGNLRGLASDGFTGGFLRASPQSTPGSLLAYDFSLHARGFADLPFPDGGSGRDAGTTAASAVQLPGACASGRLDPASGDKVDAYSLYGQFGDRWVFSISDPADAAVLEVRGTGSELLSAIRSGNLTAITLPATGTYTLTASSGSGTILDYIIGSCGPDCGPPQEPCEPACIAILDGSG